MYQATRKSPTAGPSHQVPARGSHVNQVIILAGYWWAGLLRGEVWRLAASFALPAAAGALLGMLCFRHVDHHRFRRLVFGLLLVSGVVLLAGG